ncbi:hypothetical protein KEM55_002862 [Ascosphaera atra]|nr:hypothetical protein KEM55_002862 [Ascosphaera atra]
MTVGGSRKVGEASNAIEAYKRQREQKEKREKARQLRETAGGRKSTSEDVADVERERESSDVEWEDPRRRSVSPPRDDPPAALVDVNRARIGRSGFAKLCFYPGFDESISLCFVRLSIGLNKQTGQNEYRLAQIKKFVEGKPYAMEGSNRRNFVTTQYAVLAHGKAERPFPFIACSDQPFTEAEYNRWRQTMVVDDCRIPTKSQVAQKVIDINNLLNRSFTQEELDEKLRKQGAADSKQRVFEKIQLERRRADAVAAGNDALVEECDQEIRRLVGPQKLAYGTSTRRRDDGKPRTKDQGERLAELNRRNARLNTENVRKAQIAEMKRKKEQLIKIRKGEAKPDPFARVQTRARIHYDVQPDGRMVPLESSQSQVSATLPPVGASGETNSQEETEKTETPDTNSATKAKASNGADSNNTPPNRNHSRDVLAAMPPRKGDKPSVRSAPLDEDYINALNIDIDIDM